MSNVCESCGWAAAVLSMLSFGSFGAPIKSKAAKSVDVDPLVFQSYKTFMCFCTCWIVLLLGVDFNFTPWGIVSGLFWVPGGVSMIYAIKSAGLAVAMGIASSCIVLVSFTWGIFIFEEKVESRLGASFAILLMMAGLWGMSYYSSPQASIAADHHSMTTASGAAYSGIRMHEHVDDPEDDDSDQEHEHCEETGTVGDHSTVTASSVQEAIPLCGLKVSKRKLGMAGAAFCGIWGGSIMVPMKWAPADANGMGYVISFAIGASIVTLLLWILRFLFYLSQTRSMSLAWRKLPFLHIPVLWLAGGTSGTLWSIGNFFSIISVENLGEGVGYSVAQAGMLVSGLWGIFYFEEIVGAVTISRWFVSAGLTICGILLLSYEHHEG